MRKAPAANKLPRMPAWHRMPLARSGCISWADPTDFVWCLHGRSLLAPVNYRESAHFTPARFRHNTFKRRIDQLPDAPNVIRDAKAASSG